MDVVFIFRMGKIYGVEKQGGGSCHYESEDIQYDWGNKGGRAVMTNIIQWAISMLTVWSKLHIGCIKHLCDDNQRPPTSA